MSRSSRFAQLVGPYSIDDNFTRADSSSSLGTAGPVGRAWTAHSGTWGIASNRGKIIAGAGDNVATLPTRCGRTGRIQARVTLGTDGPGVIFRAVSDQTYEIFLISSFYGGQWWRRASGAYTQIGSNISFAGYSSSRVVDIDIVLNGTSLSCSIDGAAYSTVTEPDSSFHGYNRCGLRNYGTAAALWHSFRAT